MGTYAYSTHHLPHALGGCDTSRKLKGTFHLGIDLPCWQTFSILTGRILNNNSLRFCNIMI